VKKYDPVLKDADGECVFGCLGESDVDSVRVKAVNELLRTIEKQDFVFGGGNRSNLTDFVSTEIGDGTYMATVVHLNELVRSFIVDVEVAGGTYADLCRQNILQMLELDG